MLKVKFSIHKAAGWVITKSLPLFTKGIYRYVFSYELMRENQNDFLEYIPKELFVNEIIKSIEEKKGRKEKGFKYSTFSFDIELDISEDIVFLLSLKYSKDELKEMGVKY